MNWIQVTSVTKQAQCFYWSQWLVKWIRNHGTWYMCSQVQFSSVQSLSCVWLLWPHGLQHVRPPCPSPTPGAYSNACPLSRWCHPTISSSTVPFSSRLQSFPASGSFQTSQFFTSGGQTIEASASASVLSKNIQGWFLLGLTDLISLQSKGLSRFFFNTTVQKILWCSGFFMVQLSHQYTTTRKIIAMTIQTIFGKLSLLFNMPSRSLIDILPSSKSFLIS